MSTGTGDLIPTADSCKPWNMLEGYVLLPQRRVLDEIYAFNSDVSGKEAMLQCREFATRLQQPLNARGSTAAATVERREALGSV